MIESVSQHFNERASSYDTAGTWVADDNLLRTIGQMFAKPVKRVSLLDVGAGTGTLTDYLVKLYSGLVNAAAVDLSANMADICSRQGIPCCLARAENLPFADRQFDWIVSRQCFHYVGDLHLALCEVKRVLKDNGDFVLAQIVPAEENLLEEWSEITRLRQPLRTQYLTSSGWAEAAKQVDLCLDRSETVVMRGSLSNWIKKYSPKNDQVATYREALAKASDKFNLVYKTKDNSGNLEYNVFWTIQHYSVGKTQQCLVPSERQVLKTWDNHAGCGNSDGHTFCIHGVGAIIARQHDCVDYVLIQERQKGGDAQETGLLEVPCAKVCEGDSVFDALTSKVFQETGLRVTEISEEGHFKRTQNCGYDVVNYIPFFCSQNVNLNYPIVIDFYLCHVKGEPLYSTKDAQNIRWVSLGELETLLTENESLFYPMVVEPLRKLLQDSKKGNSQTN